MPRARLASLMCILLLALLQSPALAGASDVSATRTYIQANYALVQYAANRLDTAQTLIEGVREKVRANCLNAAENSPQDPESTQMSYEVIGAMVIAAMHPAHPEILTFVHTIEHVHWSSRSLDRSIHAYAAKLRTLATLGAPNLCSDTRAWSARQFLSLPASTIRFDEKFIPAWVAIGEIPAGLKPFERPEERGQVSRSNVLENRIGEFEAEAVNRYTEIMNYLLVLP